MPQKDPLSTQERRQKVVEYRKKRLSFRDISEKLKEEEFKGCSLGTVYADYQYMLRLGTEKSKLTAEDFVLEEIETINGIHQTFYEELNKFAEFKDINIKEISESDLRKALALRENQFERAEKAARIIIECSKERSKLLGNYKPQKVEIDAADTLAQLLGVPREQIPDPHKSGEK